MIGASSKENLPRFNTSESSAQLFKIINEDNKAVEYCTNIWSYFLKEIPITLDDMTLLKGIITACHGDFYLEMSSVLTQNAAQVE